MDNAPAIKNDIESIANSMDDYVEKKILFALTIYPMISPSMLQVAIGTSIPPFVWRRKVLTRLLEEKKVIHADIKVVSPDGVERTYQRLTLPPPTPKQDSIPNTQSL